jgi:hypothetical protein
MTIPKLTWDEYKDADGNWLPYLTPREVIKQLKAERTLTDGFNRLLDQLIYRAAQGEGLNRSADDIDAMKASYRAAREGRGDGIT